MLWKFLSELSFSSSFFHFLLSLFFSLTHSLSLFGLLGNIFNAVLHDAFLCLFWPEAIEAQLILTLTPKCPFSLQTLPSKRDIWMQEMNRGQHNFVARLTLRPCYVSQVIEVVKRLAWSSWVLATTVRILSETVANSDMSSKSLKRPEKENNHFEGSRRPLKLLH